MFNLKPVLNQGFNQALGHVVYQASLNIFRAYLLLHQVGKIHSFSQLRWFCNTFWTKPTNKDFDQNWGPTRPETSRSTSPEILRCYVVKALYVLEVIRIKLKTTNWKEEHYNLSLVIVEPLIMIDVYKRSFASNIATNSAWWLNPVGNPLSGLAL